MSAELRRHIERIRTHTRRINAKHDPILWLAIKRSHAVAIVAGKPGALDFITAECRRYLEGPYHLRRDRKGKR